MIQSENGEFFQDEWYVSADRLDGLVEHRQRRGQRCQNSCAYRMKCGAEEYELPLGSQIVEALLPRSPMQ